MTYGGDQITFNDNSTQNTSATGFGFKNRIINGQMMIDQRNAGASVTVTTGTVYGADRFNSSKSTSSGTMTVQQSSIVPAGFNRSLLHTVSTGASPAAGDQNRIEHCVEGNKFADFDFGTSNAQSFTFSFWVRSSVTGTYAVAFLNAAWNRSYVATYTVNAANTWEQKTITVAGDTTGTWAKDNTVGIRFKFDLGSGSTSNTASPNQWVSGEFYRTSSTVTLLATTGATFYITGVQLEKGSTATSFDYRPYGTELALCQRYYFQTADRLTYKHFASGMWYTGTVTQLNMKFPAMMRASPTVTINSASYFDVWAGNTTLVASSLSSADSTIEDVTLAFSASGGTAGHGCMLGQTNSANKAKIYATAEL